MVWQENMEWKTTCFVIVLSLTAFIIVLLLPAISRDTNSDGEGTFHRLHQCLGRIFFIYSAVDSRPGRAFNSIGEIGIVLFILFAIVN